MVSIVQYLSEGVLNKLDTKLQNSKFGKTVDRINNKIDGVLQKTSPGRAYMKLEDTVGEAARQGTNAILNTKDRLLRRNFRVRK